MGNPILQNILEDEQTETTKREEGIALNLVLKARGELQPDQAYGQEDFFVAEMLTEACYRVDLRNHKNGFNEDSKESAKRRGLEVREVVFSPRFTGHRSAWEKPTQGHQ